MYYRLDINERGLSPEGDTAAFDKAWEKIYNAMPNADETKVDTLERSGVSGLFLFTEKGWELYGKPTADLAKEHGFRVRIQQVPEDVPTVYKDDMQVMIDWNVFEKKYTPPQQ